MNDADNDTKSNQEHDELKEFFLFELDGELYAVLVERVQRIMKIPPITPIPNSSRAVLGIFHLEGKVVVAIDLLRRMEMIKHKPLTATYLFIVSHAKDQFAILIDKPKKMFRVPVSKIQLPNPIIAAHVPPQYVSGVFMHEELSESLIKEPQRMISSYEVIDSKQEHVTEPPRPVLWLDLEKLLNQEDLMRVLASQE